MASLAESVELEKEEISRYGRQLILPEWGVLGKEGKEWEYLIQMLWNAFFLSLCILSFLHFVV